MNQEIGKLSIREKELRRTTEKGGQLGPLAERQSKIGNDTKSLLERIEKQDATKNWNNPKRDSNKSDKSQAGKPGKEGSEKKDADKPNDKNQRGERER